ncbi:MAG: hypothetical protein AAFU77_08970 [Myxococcota bacterium]
MKSTLKPCTALLGSALAAFLATACAHSTAVKARGPGASPYVIEVTTFRQNAEMTPEQFLAADRQVEANYTSKQPGFLERRSARSAEGEWVVVVYWRSVEDADASMKRFMGDPSVAQYAAAIDGGSMKMARYQSEDSYRRH